MSAVREGLVRQGAGAGDLDRDVGLGGQRQHLWQVGEGLRGRRRLERLLQPEVVDHELRVGIARGQLAGLIQPTPGQEIDRQRVARGGREDAIDAGIGGVGRERRGSA